MVLGVVVPGRASQPKCHRHLSRFRALGTKFILPARKFFTLRLLLGLAVQQLKKAAKGQGSAGSSEQVSAASADTAAEAEIPSPQLSHSSRNYQFPTPTLIKSHATLRYHNPLNRAKN